MPRRGVRDTGVRARNVPTYRTVKEGPATASRQLDYVFASRGFHEQVRAGALNEGWKIEMSQARCRVKGLCCNFGRRRLVA